MSFYIARMKFIFFVIVLLFGLNLSEPTNGPHDQVDDDDFNKQALPETAFSSVESNNREIEGHVKVLETPHKLENDKNLYRVIRLSNSG